MVTIACSLTTSAENVFMKSLGLMRVASEEDSRQLRQLSRRDGFRCGVVQ